MNKCASLSENGDHISIHTNHFHTGIEAVQARFGQVSFTPHRHDDYVIGVTDYGEQKFRYRGMECCSKPGDVFVLHPDEMHDGRPGTAQGYGYRAIYLRPMLVTKVLEHMPLPFVPNPVIHCSLIRSTVEAMLSPQIIRDTDLEPTDKLIALVDALCRLSGHSTIRTNKSDLANLEGIRAMFESDPANQVQMKDLEAEFGISRYSITRQFKRYTGTSPHRFLIMRRLELVKRSLLQGASLADVASDCGFADQSHLTRIFRQTFGISPSLWMKISTVSK